MRASFTLELSALSAGDEVCNPITQRYPVGTSSHQTLPEPKSRSETKPAHATQALRPVRQEPPANSEGFTGFRLQD